MKRNLGLKWINLSIPLVLLFVFKINSVAAQGTKVKLSTKDHIAWVYTTEGKIKGPIVGIEDNYLEIRNLAFGKYDQVARIESINIEKIKIYRKGKVGRGLILGGASGAFFGVVLGLVSGDDQGGFIIFKAEEKALIFGAFFAIPGTIIGGILGTKKIKIPIKNKHQNYVQKKELISKYKRY